MPRQSQPSHIDRLLQSLIKSMSVVPVDADAIHDESEMPSDWLRNVIIEARGAERSWRGWMDTRLQVWLFVAELALPLSRQMRAPVLHVNFYRESGLQESGNWSVDRNSKWHRCLIAAPSAPDANSSEGEPTLAAIDFYRPGISRKVR